MPSLSKHWNFAAARAFSSLEEITHSFDFNREAASASYVGITPHFLIEIIDGFLAEGDDVVPPGNRQSLLRCRQLLASRIQAAFDQGLAAGEAAYQSSPHLRESWNAETIRGLAANAAPDEQLVRGWFMEAFCYAWATADLEYVRKQHSG